MENENDNDLMVLDVQQIVFKQGYIEFNEYENLKQQALELAEYIAAVEVDPENVKESKKLLAAVNKQIKILEDKRIVIKKCLNEPYMEFEQQVKEIVQIVKEADEIVRQQVKALEEKERQAKQDLLAEIFNKRMVHYSFRDLFSFEDFLKPQHLNKTISIDAVEKEMIAYLEKLTKDLKAIEAMPKAQEVLSLYMDTKDLAAALTMQQQQEQRKQQIEQAQALKKETGNKIAYLVSVNCANEKELKLLTMILEQNGFEYSTDKILGGN